MKRTIEINTCDKICNCCGNIKCESCGKIFNKFDSEKIERCEDEKKNIKYCDNCASTKRCSRGCNVCNKYVLGTCPCGIKFYKGTYSPF